MSNWLELEGKIAVVTGGGSGIGRSTAIALAEAGCQVFVLDLSSAAAEDNRRRDPNWRLSSSRPSGRHQRFCAGGRRRATPASGVGCGRYPGQ